MLCFVVVYLRPSIMKRLTLFALQSDLNDLLKCNLLLQIFVNIRL